MCGIAGLLEISQKRDRNAIDDICKTMCSVIMHRGPDNHDVWQDPNTPLALGHRRLAIIDLSERGKQPMSSASERYVITYNGEIYNYPKLQKELEDLGVNFKGYSDTEILLACIEQWGLNLALSKCNGMFAFALWDKKEKTLHLIRDRLGKKPLYFGWAGKSLVFGSELKSICAHPDFKPKVSSQALSHYMQYGYVKAPNSIYQNIWSLPAGFRISLEVDNLQPGEDLLSKMQSYWHHLKILQEQKSKIEKKFEVSYINQCEALLSSAVKNRMMSDVPLGAFLSGGIDSSLVVALMQKHSQSPIKTYTIGFKEDHYDEAGYAAKIAHHLGTDHHEHYLDAKQAQDIIPSLSQIYDEPFADISAIPTYLVSKFAKKDVTVALSGDGGDEFFAGYNRHMMGPKLWNILKLLPTPFRLAAAKVIMKKSPQEWNDFFKNKPQIGEKIYKVLSSLHAQSPQELYNALLTHWDPDLEILSEQKQEEFLFDSSEWTADNLQFVEEIMYNDTLSYLPNDILTKGDRASMAVSLELRSPLLDKNLYEFAWQLPHEYKIRNGQGKYILRQVLERYVPTSLFERPKQGFSISIDEWLRGPMRDWAESLLDKNSLEEHGFFQAEKIQKTWQEHIENKHHHGTKLWTILMFQTWQKRWL